MPSLSQKNEDGEGAWQLSSQVLCEDCDIEVLPLTPGGDNWKVLKDPHGKPD